MRNIFCAKCAQLVLYGESYGMKRLDGIIYVPVINAEKSLFNVDNATRTHSIQGYKFRRGWMRHSLPVGLGYTLLRIAQMPDHRNQPALEYLPVTLSGHS